ncbi:hypothetical protein J2W48_001681 [Flavobacterium piscis]|uniref:Flagellar motor protein MotA n=1 Tax=Flavobacterium piscis TaxID=1114874 RepID=A0ABU1Y6H9_9FLAO|nr:hypothetical protein [Flavobacterium piscis]
MELLLNLVEIVSQMQLVTTAGPILIGGILIGA